MNHTGQAFRSHLMQQFLTQARGQSRPPLALVGVLTDDKTLEEPKSSSSSESTGAAPTNSTRGIFLQKHFSNVTPSGRPAYPANLRRRHTDGEIFASSKRLLNPISFVHEEHDDHATQNEESQDLDNLSIQFQEMMQSRRSTSRFQPWWTMSSLSSYDASSLGIAIPSEAEQLKAERLYWMQALERAVRCGCQAPHHGRNPPFSFTRLVAPSTATTRLAEIALEVHLRQQQKTYPQKSHEQMQEAARRKQSKWSRIPAFLITTVQSSRGENDKETASSPSKPTKPHTPQAQDTPLLDPYEPLPHAPLTTERAMEDYAASCAAVQNVLLSLHSEGLSSKWITGPVTRTPAFMDLIKRRRARDESHARQDLATQHGVEKQHQDDDLDEERIVALIMVGHAEDMDEHGDNLVASLSSSSPRHRRRSSKKQGRALHGDLLIDL